MDRLNPNTLSSSRDLEHKLIVASFCKYLDEHAASMSSSSDAGADESLTVVADLLRESAKLDRDTQQRLGQLDFCSSARQYLNNFNISLAGLKSFYQSYLATIPPASDEHKRRAEEHKERGNQLVADGRENEALKEYNKAVELDRKNAVYYCNRAAAYTGLNKFEDAIYDCHLSLAADAKYVKAFGRLGVACLKADRLAEAKRATERALELDPSNERYKSNLQLIEERMQQQPAGAGGARAAGGASAPPSGGGADNQRATAAAGGFGGMGFDPSMISGVLNNPQFMSMAQQVMGDPRIQQALGSVASQFTGGFQQQQQQNQQQNPQQQTPGGTANTGNAAPGGGGSGTGAGGFNINDMLGNLTSQLFRPDSDLTRNIWEAAQQATSQQQQQPRPPNSDQPGSNPPSGDKKDDDSSKKDKKPDGSSGGGTGTGSGSSYFS